MESSYRLSRREVGSEFDCCRGYRRQSGLYRAIAEYPKPYLLRRQWR